MKKILIAPSILSADFADLKNEIKKVETAGADWLHIDVMDGRFVPNITIGAPVVRAIRKVTKMPLDVHLMIVEPLKYVNDFADAGADIITVHIEACGNDALKTIEAIKQRNIKTGISIKPNTPVKDIENLLDKVDLVLVMTVEPGFGGQEFMGECLDKVREIKAIAEKQGRDFHIQVDGGVNAQTAKLCTSAGVDVLVAGSYVYRADDVRAAIDSLR
jgi:ribulose-phosphate 3-epimerase